jgi:predicted nucleotide-binding protein (sugar kinase/HSP70/actin superfamily)
VLQGGTQHNLAAVKAQVDFIQSRFRGQDTSPHIVVHRHCGESGAIGAALEAMRVRGNRSTSNFIGLERTAATTYITTTDERTRCHFCKNACLRTFVDIQFATNGRAPSRATALAGEGAGPSQVPKVPGARRLILGNSCEKGLVEDVDDMRVIKAQIDATVKDTPNLVEVAARAAFRSYAPASVADGRAAFAVTPAQLRRSRLVAARGCLRIGMPKVLSMYTVAPLFRTYFESLGVQPRNVVFSDFTSAKLYKDGAKRGAIDPCFPSKLGIPHVHNLIYVKHARNPLDIIFFPMIDDVPSDLESAIGHRICPTITATPEATRAAFIKEEDVFAKKGIRFMNTFVNIGQAELFERQMYEAFRSVLGVSAEENRRAVAAGLNALSDFSAGLRSEANKELKRLEREGRIGIVLLGRPYHADHGINHDILSEFQKLGYPIFTPASLPVDDEVLEPLFGDDVRAGVIEEALDVRDVWKNAYSENSNWKLWAAKFAARHPNLIALEVTSFRCGHDSPIFSVIERIVEASGTPFFCFKDLDENKPSGSIKIRVETIHYFLKRFKEGLVSPDELRHRIRAEAAHYRDEQSQLVPSEPPLIQLTVR